MELLKDIFDITNPIDSFLNQIPQYKQFKEKNNTFYIRQITFYFLKVKTKLKSKENKKLFDKIFKEKLIQSLQNGFNEKDYQNFKNHLSKIEENLDFINQYSLEIYLNQENEKQGILLNFQKELSSLRKEVINKPDNNLKEKFLDQIIQSLAENKFLKNTDLKLDKNWSFDDIDIKEIYLQGNYKVFFAKDRAWIFNGKRLIKKVKNIKDYTFLKLNGNYRYLKFETDKRIYIFFGNPDKNKFQAGSISIKNYKKIFEKNLWQKIVFNWKKFFDKSHIAIQERIHFFNKYYPLKDKKNNFTIAKNLPSKISYHKKEKKTKEKISYKKENLLPKDLTKISNKELHQITNIEKRMKIINKILNSEKFQPILEKTIWEFKDKVITFIYQGHTIKIKFTKEFIEKNMPYLKNNLKTLIKIFVFVESKGDPLVKNRRGSSAKGLGQWLTQNGEHKKHNGRWERNTNSFETSLNFIKTNYPKDFWKKYLPLLEKYNFRKKTNLSPFQFDPFKQLAILCLSFTEKKILSSKTLAKLPKQEQRLKSITGDYFIAAALLGNFWSIKQYYLFYHHTKPNKKVINLIRKGINLYSPEIINFNLKSKKFSDLIAKN